MSPRVVVILELLAGLAALAAAYVFVLQPRLQAAREAAHTQENEERAHLAAQQQRMREAEQERAKALGDRRKLISAFQGRIEENERVLGQLAQQVAAARQEIETQKSSVLAPRELAAFHATLQSSTDAFQIKGVSKLSNQRVSSMELLNYQVEGSGTFAGIVQYLQRAGQGGKNVTEQSLTCQVEWARFPLMQAKYLLQVVQWVERQ